MQNSFSVDGESITITMRNGYVAIIDAEDIDRVNDRTWRLHWGRAGKTPYAVSGGGSGGTIRMHTRIAGDAPEGMVIDHINRNGLDNRKSNLRIVPFSINTYNRGMQSNNPSGYRGVFRCTKTKNGIGPREYWEAKIGYKGKSIYLGCFATASEAAMAYDAKAIELYGDDANLNRPKKEAA